MATLASSTPHSPTSHPSQHRIERGPEPHTAHHLVVAMGALRLVEVPFPFPFVTLRLFGPSARPSLAPRCWPGDPSACHIGRKPCGSAAPHTLYAAPGGDLPRSGCSYRSGITGTPACPLMGARRGSASSQLCGCDFLPPPRGDLPRSGVAFRSSSSSRPPTARLKGRTI